MLWSVVDLRLSASLEDDSTSEVPSTPCLEPVLLTGLEWHFSRFVTRAVSSLGYSWDIGLLEPRGIFTSWVLEHMALRVEVWTTLLLNAKDSWTFFISSRARLPSWYPSSSECASPTFQTFLGFCLVHFLIHLVPCSFFIITITIELSKPGVYPAPWRGLP